MTFRLQENEYDINEYKKLPLFERRLKFLIQDTPHSHKVPVWIESGAGLGKTTRTRDFVEKVLKRKCHVIYLAISDISDITGLMELKGGVTSWAKPSWLADIKEGDVLVLDELNRCPVYVLNAIMSVFLENRLHTHVLPKNVQKIALCNHDDGNYAVTSITDPAILSRFIRLKYSLDAGDWEKYSLENGVDSAMVDALGKETSMFNNKDNENYVMEYYPNPRGATTIGRLLNVPNDLYDAVNGYELATGMIGEVLATLYDKSRRNKLTTISDTLLLKEYKSVKGQVQSALLIKDIQLIDQLNRKLINWIANNIKVPENIPTFAKELQNICTYIIEDLPDGNALAFFKLLEQKIPLKLYIELMNFIDTNYNTNNLLFDKLNTAYANPIAK